MTYWKVHAGWGLATVLAAAAWGRHCIPARESDVPRRAARAIDPDPKSPAPDSLPQSSAPVPARGPESPSTRPDGPPDYAFERLTTDQIRALIRSENGKDWSRAAEAISKLSDKGLQKELLLELLPCKEEWVRFAALSKLADLMGPAILPLMQKAIRSDPSAWIRRNAAIQLGKLGGDGTVEALLQAAHDEDLYTQVNVAAALNRLGQPGAVANLVPRLAKDLGNDDDAIRRDAVGNLAELKSAAVIPFLLQALKDGNAVIRSDAHEGLDQLDVPEVLPAVEAMLKEPGLGEVTRDLLKDLQERKSGKK